MEIVSINKILLVLFTFVYNRRNENNQETFLWADNFFCHNCANHRFCNKHHNWRFFICLSTPFQYHRANCKYILRIKLFFSYDLSKISFYAIDYPFLQGITMIMNNFLFLGIFLYCFGIALLFCYGYFKSNQKIKIFAYPTPLFLSFFFILPVNLPKFFMAWAYLLFLFFSYLYLYNTIKKTIFERFPFLCDKISKKELPEPGKTINLVDYGLSERQVEIIKKYETGISNYKELAVFFITSESTIKQEMSRICKIFGVENARILFILLQQYNIE